MNEYGPLGAEGNRQEMIAQESQTMTRKHTAGPWIVANEDNGTYIRSKSRYGGMVASVEAGSQPMRDADARLIAAAPELLEVLSKILEHLSKTDRVLADDAIAKATSGESRHD